MVDQIEMRNQSQGMTQADEKAIREIAEVLIAGSDFIRGVVIGYAEAYRDAAGRKASA